MLKTVNFIKFKNLKHDKIFWKKLIRIQNDKEFEFLIKFGLFL